MFKKTVAVISIITCMAAALQGCGNQPGTGGDSSASSAVSGEVSVSSGKPAEKAKSAGVVKGSAFPAFETVDLDGNPVTNEIFSGKDLTMVNIWGTFCGPCLSEMPELERLSQEFPENVQIIGLVLDVGTIMNTKQIDSTKQVLMEAGVTFPNLVTKAPDFSDFVSQLVGVPTTVFVDRDGNIVGKPIIGAKVKAYEKFVEDYLNAQ